LSSRDVEGLPRPIVGKWHLGSEGQGAPTNQGFDEYHVGIVETTDGALSPEAAGIQRVVRRELAILRARNLAVYSEIGSPAFSSELTKRSASSWRTVRIARLLNSAQQQMKQI
jgi:hypothetical protein